MLSETSTMLNMAFEDLHHVAAQPFSYALLAILLFSITIFSAVRNKAPKLDAPFFGDEEGNPEAAKKRWMTDSINLLREGYSKYPDKVFQVWTTEGNQLVLPPKFINEVKMKTDDILPSALADFLQGKYITFGSPDRPSGRVPHIVKHEFNKNMPVLFPGVKDEIEYSLPREFPQNLTDWTPIKFYPRVCKLIFRISGRAFAGPTLHRNDDWMMINIQYTLDAFKAAAEVRKYPEWVRPLAKYFVPEVRTLWKHNMKAVKYLAPLIKERNRAEKQPDYEKPSDMLEWMRDLLPEWEKKDYLYQAIQQLGIEAASIHTTSQAITNVIYDLATHPEYLPELREEVTTVLNKYDGEWTIDGMLQLKTMDSFMKESSRFSPTAISFLRKAMQPLTLSDGTYIPKGTNMTAPVGTFSFDPNLYENLDKFDGLRFYRMRQDPKEVNKHQFVSTGNTQLMFGGGRHACPGRWFVSHEIKLILSTLIMEYDKDQGWEETEECSLPGAEFPRSDRGDLV